MTRHNFGIPPYRKFSIQHSFTKRLILKNPLIPQDVPHELANNQYACSLSIPQPIIRTDNIPK